MLVLTRREGHYVKIKTPEGRIIEIAITRLTNSNVHLGFKCDREVTILRGEVLEWPDEKPPEDQA